MNFVEVSTGDANAIMAEVEEWFTQEETAGSPVSVIFNNSKATAKYAVAEYIANQRGLTFYTLRTKS